MQNMNTRTRSIVAFLSLLSLTVIGNFPLASQSSAKETPAIRTEAKRLVAESEKHYQEAEQLRASAVSTKGETFSLLLEEAAALETLAVEKHCRSLKLQYEDRHSIATINDQKIEKYRALILANRHKVHTQFLVEESRKNIRLAEELYLEGNAIANPALQEGSLDNALEKLNKALNQQLDIFIMLKEEDGKVASGRKK